nr:VacJ family lipoprotein [uncultured Tolumonas sp.]
MMPIRKLLSVIVCGLFSYTTVASATTVTENRAPAQPDILATHISSDYPSGPGGSTDSFPTFNRAMWWFNYDIMDKHVLRPVVHGYVKWVPTPFRTGVSNFVNNLEEPNNVVNNMLLGEVKHSGASLARFSLNSTVGMLGLFDIATDMGIDRHRMTMSTVLGRAKVTQGPYFMIPVAGPMTLRSGIGRVVDSLYWPYSYMGTSVTLAKFAIDGLDARSKVIDQESIIDNAFDPYVTTRDFYLQYEEAKVQGKKAAEMGSATKHDPAADAEVEKYLDEIDK